MILDIPQASLPPNCKKYIFGNIEFGEFKKGHDLFRVALVHRIDLLVGLDLEQHDPEEIMKRDNYNAYLEVGSCETYYDLDAITKYLQRVAK